MRRTIVHSMHIKTKNKRCTLCFHCKPVAEEPVVSALTLDMIDNQTFQELVLASAFH